MMIFKFYSGVRSGEAIGLMWKFVHFDTKKIDIRFTMRDGRLKFPKEEKIRTIDMLPQAEKALKELEKLSGKSSWVFLTQNKKGPYTNPFGPARLWNQVVARAKDFKPARFYNTRHSFTTNMLSRNMNPEWLIQQLGHESIVITRNSYEGKIEPNYDNMPKVVF
jgi:integrase